MSKPSKKKWINKKNILLDKWWKISHGKVWVNLNAHNGPCEMKFCLQRDDHAYISLLYIYQMIDKAESREEI